MAVTFRKAVKYVVLPGFVPRIIRFFTTGFSQLAFFIAMAFGSVGLLPALHPFLNPENNGRFGIRLVMAEGRRFLVFRRENADQVIIYYTIYGAFFLIFFQVGLFLLSLSAQAALAASLPTGGGDVGSWWAKFLVTPNPAGDIAFIMLDYVFGFKGLYGSCADPSITCPSPLHNSKAIDIWPSPFHTALHGFLNFYDIGVAVVGMIIFLYLIVAIVGETAQSGQPFGRRYNHWAPIRLMLAIALIAPLSDGLNGAQKGVLYVAKWGSSLATNGWIQFNQTIAASTPMGMPANLVVNPTPPEAGTFLAFMLLAKTCLYAEKSANGRNIQAWQIITTSSMDDDTGEATTTTSAVAMPTDFATALGPNNANYHDIVLRFGEQSTDYTQYTGNVRPICGEMVINPKSAGTPGQQANTDGALTVQKDYYQMIVDRWNDSDNDMYAKNIALSVATTSDKKPSAVMPTEQFITDSRTWFNQQATKAITDGRTATQNNPKWMENFTVLGWGGAALWYNKVAEYNGSLIASVFAVPLPSRYPEAMEYMKQQHKEHDKVAMALNFFNPFLNDNTIIHPRTPNDWAVMNALTKAKDFWGDHDKPSHGTPIDDMLTNLFGLQGLMSMPKNTSVHPLAQLVGIGRSLIERSVEELGGAIFVGGLNNGLQKAFQYMGNSTGAGRSTGQGISTIGSGILNIAKASFMAGFFLYFVIPFLPFIYFFFAVGDWVKAVFEAMVGLPLWALSFLKIDGEGALGPNAANGWYLLLEIFIRPFLITISLVASIAIFAAQVSVLSQIWDLVISNLTGADTKAAAQISPGAIGSISSVREVIDQFMYTVLYAIITYMLGLSSFKLIDLIPTQILRWMGTGMRGFGTGMDSGGQFVSAMETVSMQVQSVFGGGALNMLIGRN